MGLFYGKKSADNRVIGDSTSTDVGSSPPTAGSTHAGSKAIEKSSNADTNRVQSILKELSAKEEVKDGYAIPDYSLDTKLSDDPGLRKEIYNYIQNFMLRNQEVPKDQAIIVLLHQMQSSAPEETETFAIDTLKKMEVSLGQDVSRSDNYRGLVYFLGENSVSHSKVLDFFLEARGTERCARGLLAFVHRTDGKSTEVLARAKNELRSEMVSVTDNKLLKEIEDVLDRSDRE